MFGGISKSIKSSKVREEELDFFGAFPLGSTVACLVTNAAVYFCQEQKRFDSSFQVETFADDGHVVNRLKVLGVTKRPISPIRNENPAVWPSLLKSGFLSGPSSEKAGEYLARFLSLAAAPPVSCGEDDCWYPPFCFPDMPCMKSICKNRKASVHWSATRNEQRPWSRR